MSQIEFVQMDESWRDRYETLQHWTWPSSLSPEQRSAAPLPFDWEHSFALADGSRLAAVSAYYPFPNLPVPGGRVQANGLTSVAVQPTYRRQGLLRRMITRYLETSVARGDVLSLLYAQDYRIYGRFGYGHASNTYNLRIPHAIRLIAPRHAQDEKLRIDFDYADPDRDAPFIHAVQRAQTRPGTPIRQLTGFQRDALIGEPAPAQPLRILRVSAGDGAPLAYAVFTRPHIDDETGVAPVTDWSAADGTSEHALWQALIDLDLVRTVEAQRVPVDSPLVSMLPDPREAKPTLHDDMFARMLDLPGCLAAREYSADVDLVIRVTDPILPANEGLWKLRIDDGRAEATRADTGADAAGDVAPALTMSIAQLSAAYLGRPVLAGLARAGQLEEHADGAADALHRAMVWHVQPGGTWSF